MPPRKSDLQSSCVLAAGRDAVLSAVSLKYPLRTVQRPCQKSHIGPCLRPGLEISPIVTGLRQIADMERDGQLLDHEKASAAMADYAAEGVDTFDMADHYGSAEVISGRFVEPAGKGAFDLPPDCRPHVFTKWCPEPGAMTADAVRAGVMERLARL